MSVQLIIDGNHITDVLAQVQALAQAVEGPTLPAPSVPKAEVKEEPKQADKPAPEKEDDTPKKLTRKEQEDAVAEMVKAGEKDERFDLLTKGRQREVEDALVANVENGVDAENQQEEDLSSMFDEDDADAPEEITGDHIRQVMAEKGKDADGDPIQDNLLKIREILTKHVPKGAEVKVGNIPSDKLAAAYAELKAL